ncbi:MAG: hypothetical protein K8R55_03530 [Desulfuromonadaceae bacterium]|nr:hypothetical protein [Desulfuromonadaceae bacterium]
MKKQRLSATVLLLTLVIMFPTSGFASSRQGHRQGPPPEAIEACKGKSVGDSVKVTGRRGESLEATCQEKDQQLVAVPDNMPEHGGRR